MKRQILTLSILALLSALIPAQTLNIKIGSVTYRFPAEGLGPMNYKNGNALEVSGHTFNLSEISSMNVVEDEVENGVVVINYNEDAATATIAGDIASYVEVTIDGANVSVMQSADAGENTSGEITYRLSGTTQNGSFYMEGSYKSSLELVGVNIFNPSGAAINIQNGKRIAVRVAEDTDNKLEDGKDGSQKGCFVCKGHLEFKQKGSLTVIGNASHAIYAKEYVEIKNTTLNIEAAKKDGINCTQYFLMESGTLNISGTGDDGIQVAFKDDADREEEDTGSITIERGRINISVTNDASKALKAEGNFYMRGGEITAETSGNAIWDSDKNKTKASSCIGVDGMVLIETGTLNLISTGGGGKGISSNGEMTINGGIFTIHTEGGLAAYINGILHQNYNGNPDRLNSDYKSSPKAIKCDGDIEINDGMFDIVTKGYGGEGIESKANLTINGGDIKIRAFDDGTNSSNDTYINGGTLDIMSTGEADGVDSNRNIYVTGGVMRIFGANQPEEGFDAGDGYGIFFTGGDILAVGGRNSVPSGSQTGQAYLSLSESVTAGDTVSVINGDDTLISFLIPEDYSPRGGNFGGGWDPRAPGGGGFGGSIGGGLLISCPTLVKNQTYTVKIGDFTTSATAR